MGTLLTVIWLIFAGIWLAILYVRAGVLVCLTIIGKMDPCASSVLPSVVGSVAYWSSLRAALAPIRRVDHSARRPIRVAVGPAGRS